jgi:hypothetical protein
VGVAHGGAAHTLVDGDGAVGALHACREYPSMCMDGEEEERESGT